ncbi:hypothetical protein V6N12_039714 [Hibiscus sabdariffa]|uniref:Uncharacterized protein n=1 Tax=Hibiscus sabdariffa TaxID=183260 RepID=A0ABR2E1G7_9ROSI
MKKAVQLMKRLSPSLSTIFDFNSPAHSLLSSSPWWSASQPRGLKVNAIHIIDLEHKRQRGRGGALMQMELRDVDNGNKVSLRFGPEEPVERVVVEEKSFTITCLYKENNAAFLFEDQTFDQLQVPLDLFGKSAAYLKEEMKVRLQLYDGRPLTAAVPKRVTCTIKETQTPMKGVSATHRYKKALLDNGLAVQVPPYLDAGEEIIINTEDDSYIGREHVAISPVINSFLFQGKLIAVHPNRSYNLKKKWDEDFEIVEAGHRRDLGPCIADRMELLLRAWDPIQYLVWRVEPDRSDTRIQGMAQPALALETHPGSALPGAMEAAVAPTAALSSCIDNSGRNAPRSWSNSYGYGRE